MLGYLSPVHDRYDWIRDRREHLPCDGLDLGDLARIQQGICSTAEGSPDIEGDDEFSREASVAGRFHDGRR